MSIQLTPEFVRTAISARHPNSKKCEELAEKLSVHESGRVPTKLINERRPNESEATKKYRASIYVPVTQEPLSKLFSSLQKIRRSQDWSIQYGDDIPKQIAKGETLEDYCERNYAGFSSLTNWAFSELLKRSLIDANSICAVILKKLPEKQNEYLKPEVEIFSSSQIMDYVPDEYYVLKSADTIQQKGRNGVAYSRAIYYIITTTQIARYEEAVGGGYNEAFVYDHNMGFLPLCKVGGIYHERINNDTIQKSRIAQMVPFLDEAAREYSDLQAEIVQHVFSEKMVFTTNECPACKGSTVSKEKDEDGNFKVCGTCQGTGRISGKSPYGEYQINIAQYGENQVPNPAISYVQKNTEIPRLQNERVNEHIYKALSSVNMEFLAKTPLNQSGKAKEVDKDELDTFVNSIAEDIVMVLDNVYKFINEYRYSVVVPNKDERKKLLPTIPVPERFGLLNSSILMQDIQSAKNSNVNPVLVKNMEVELARKKYNANPEIAYELESVFELDPFYGFTQQEKMTMRSNNGITELDYVISCNIVQFVQRAMKEKDDFSTQTFEQKRKIIIEYAKEVMKENSEKEKIQVEIEEEIEE